MKKFLKNLRNITILFLWTYLFIFIAKNFALLVWNFNILSQDSWDIISTYWNKGGSFKTSQDLIFITFLLSLPFLYLFGFKRIQKINFSKIFLSVFNRFFEEKIADPERVVIKGMKTNKQYIDEIKGKIESIKPEKNKEPSEIRSSILKKINEETKK